MNQDRDPSFTPPRRSCGLLLDSTIHNRINGDDLANCNQSDDLTRPYPSGEMVNPFSPLSGVRRSQSISIKSFHSSSPSHSMALLLSSSFPDLSSPSTMSSRVTKLRNTSWSRHHTSPIEHEFDDNRCEQKSLELRKNELVRAETIGTRNNTKNPIYVQINKGSPSRDHSIASEILGIPGSLVRKQSFMSRQHSVSFSGGTSTLDVPNSRRSSGRSTLDAPNSRRSSGRSTLDAPNSRRSSGRSTLEAPNRYDPSDISSKSFGTNESGNEFLDEYFIGHIPEFKEGFDSDDDKKSRLRRFVDDEPSIDGRSNVSLTEDIGSVSERSLSPSKIPKHIICMPNDMIPKKPQRQGSGKRMSLPQVLPTLSGSMSEISLDSQPCRPQRYPSDHRMVDHQTSATSNYEANEMLSIPNVQRCSTFVDDCLEFDLKSLQIDVRNMRIAFQNKKVDDDTISLTRASSPRRRGKRRNNYRNSICSNEDHPTRRREQLGIEKQPSKPRRHPSTDLNNMIIGGCKGTKSKIENRIYEKFFNENVLHSNGRAAIDNDESKQLTLVEPIDAKTRNSQKVKSATIEGFQNPSALEEPSYLSAVANDGIPCDVGQKALSNSNRECQASTMTQHNVETNSSMAIHVSTVTSDRLNSSNDTMSGIVTTNLQLETSRIRDNKLLANTKFDFGQRKDETIAALDATSNITKTYTPTKKSMRCFSSFTLKEAITAIPTKAIEENILVYDVMTYSDERRSLRIDTDPLTCPNKWIETGTYNCHPSISLSPRTKSNDSLSFSSPYSTNLSSLDKSNLPSLNSPCAEPKHRCDNIMKGMGMGMGKGKVYKGIVKANSNLFSDASFDSSKLVIPRRRAKSEDTKPFTWREDETFFTIENDELATGMS